MNKKDLIDAIKKNDMDKFWLCFDRKVDLDSKTSDGIPMLILAVKFKRTELIWYLLYCGANPDITDGSGKTAMDWANEQNYKMAKLILQEFHAKTSEQLAEEIYRDRAPEAGSTVRRRRTHFISLTPPATSDGGAGGGGAGAGPITPREVEPEQTSLLATLFGMFSITPTRYEPDLKDHRSGERVVRVDSKI